MSSPKGNSRKRAKKRKAGEPRENPVSLAPLDFEKALAGLLVVKPTPKDNKKPEKEEKKRPASE
jgi:hypothetical protein